MFKKITLPLLSLLLILSPSLWAREKLAWISGIDPESKEPALLSLRTSGFEASFAPKASAESSTSQHLIDWLKPQTFNDTYLWIEIHGPINLAEIDIILTHLDRTKGLSSIFVLIDGSGPDRAKPWSPNPSPKIFTAVRITSNADFIPLLSRTLHNKNLNLTPTTPPPNLHTSLFQSIIALKQGAKGDLHHINGNTPSEYWWKRPLLNPLSIPTHPDTPPVANRTTPPDTSSHLDFAPLPDFLDDLPTPKEDPVAKQPTIVTPSPMLNQAAPVPLIYIEPDIITETAQNLPERPAHLSQYFANSPLSDSYLIRQSRTLRLAQSRLKSLDFYQSRIDGSPGPGTHRAIVSFQKEHQIPVSGILDTPTLKALDVQISNDEFRSDTRGLNPLQDSSRYRYYSSSDRRRVIKEIQRILKEENHYQGSLDGSPGPMFFQALLNFQTTHSLPKTLTIDSTTQSQLTKAGMQSINATPRPTKQYKPKQYKPTSRTKPKTKTYTKPKPRRSYKKPTSRPKRTPSSPKVLPFLE